MGKRHGKEKDTSWNVRETPLHRNFSEVKILFASGVTH
jgi:hypothetical protein